MILSMTGYGKAVATYKDKKINVEVKSLNSKSLDLSTRIAPIYREKEMEIRRMLSKSLERGKVDFAIWIEKETSVDPTPINAKLVENYYHQIKDIAAQTGIPEPQDWFYTLLRMPDVETRIDTVVLTDEEWEIARKTIEEAVQALTDFRKQEGEALERKFNEKVDNIEALLHSIEPYEQQRVPKIKEKILEGLKQIPEVEYDKNRLEQELIYYIEKLDISEEKQRLTNHLKYFRETMRETGHGVGKKLGFIAQEMGREIEHDRFQEQPGGDAEHRRPHEGRAGADQGTSSQRIVIMEKGKLIDLQRPEWQRQEHHCVVAHGETPRTATGFLHQLHQSPAAWHRARRRGVFLPHTRGFPSQDRT